MTVRSAQKIVNKIYDRTGINLACQQNQELEWLKDQLEEFLDLEVETEELTDPEDADFEGSSDEDEEE